ncbi:MAG: alpha/beta hydrolase [Hyphomicrobiales bacterium]|nr:alpha/beta hydrolase [Hyphomicrobiales bacterium]
MSDPRPVIVMVHGMWGNAMAWDNYRPFFEDRGYRVLTPSLRHHGQPGDTPDPALATTSLLDYADDLQALIAGLEEKPVVMGHSMGGLIAQMLAARGLARAAVFLTPAAPAGIIALTPTVIRTFWRIMRTWGFWHMVTFPTLKEASYAVYNLLPPLEQQAEYAKLVPESGRATFEIGFWTLDRRRAARVDAAAVICPVLTVGAARDRITPARVVQKVAARYPAGTYIEFPDHAHWVLGEHGWQDVAAFCAEWLGDQGLAPEAA